MRTHPRPSRYLELDALQEAVRWPTVERRTMNIGPDALPGLAAALEVYAQVLQAIREGKTLVEILEQNLLPGSLRAHPSAVVLFLPTRDNLIQRLYHHRTCYWKPDGDGLAPDPARPERRGMPHRRCGVIDATREGRCTQRPSRVASIKSAHEVMTFFEIVDEPGMDRLPPHQIAGHCARRRAINRDEGGHPAEVLACIPGSDGGHREAEMSAAHFGDGADTHITVPPWLA